MANAFIMITTEPTKSESIGARLRSMKGAIVYEVLSPFDFIVNLEAETTEALTSTLRGDIRSIPGVSATLTCTVVDGKSPEAQAL